MHPIWTSYRTVGKDGGGEKKTNTTKLTVRNKKTKTCFIRMKLKVLHSVIPTSSVLQINTYSHTPLSSKAHLSSRSCLSVTQSSLHPECNKGD